MEYDVVHGEMTTITDTEYYTPGNIPFKRTRIITERYNNNFNLASTSWRGKIALPLSQNY